MKNIFGLHRNVFYVGLVSLFMDISSEMVYPLLPLFLANTLGASKTFVGIIEGIAEATASLLKIVSGWISDRMGRRKLLMSVGYGVSVLSRPLIASSNTWAEVLFARFIDRFGKGIRTAPRDAIIAESVETERLGRAYGFHRTMDTIGAVIGPAIAFLLLLAYAGNYRLVFYLSAIPGVIAVLLIIFLLKESAKGAASSSGHSGSQASNDEGLLSDIPLPWRRSSTARLHRAASYPLVLIAWIYDRFINPSSAPGRVRVPSLSIKSFNGPFRKYIVVIAIFSLGNSADAFLVLRAESLGVETELIPIIYLFFTIIHAAVSTPMGLLADRVGLRKVVLGGFVLYALIYAGLALAMNQTHIWVLFALYGVCKAMSEGMHRAYLAKLAPSDRKATAFGVYHMVAGMMLLPASIIAGSLWDTTGPEAAFAFGSALSVIAAIIFATSAGAKT